MLSEIESHDPAAWACGLLVLIAVFVIVALSSPRKTEWVLMPLLMLIAAVPHVRSVGNSVDVVRGGLHNCGSVRLDFVSFSCYFFGYVCLLP